MADGSVGKKVPAVFFCTGNQLSLHRVVPDINQIGPPFLGAIFDRTSEGAGEYRPGDFTDGAELDGLFPVDVPHKSR